ncbi:MAG: hypothetical protein ACFE7E_04350 [Candidatus Hodarchaeota archaeon]
MTEPTKISRRKIIGIAVAVISITIIIYLLVSGLWYDLLSIIHSASALVKTSVYEIYLAQLDYLVTNMVLSILLHILMLVVITLFTTEHDSSKDVSPDSEEIQKNGIWTYLRLFPLRLLKRVLVAICWSKSSFSRTSPDEKQQLEGEKIDVPYLVVSMITGGFIALFLVLMSQFNYFLFICFYLIIVALVLWLLIGLSWARYFGRLSAERMGIGYNRSRLIVDWGKEDPCRFYLGEKVALLGLSLGTGLIGILTTVGASIMVSTISFSLIPVTFSTISVLTAMLEFPGLKALPQVFREAKKLTASILTILLVISWSLYLTGVLWVILLSPLLKMSQNLMLAIMSTFWIITAVTLSIVIHRVVVTKGMIITSLFFTVLPFLLLLI